MVITSVHISITADGTTIRALNRPSNCGVLLNVYRWSACSHSSSVANDNTTIRHVLRNRNLFAFLKNSQRQLRHYCKNMADSTSTWCLSSTVLVLYRGAMILLMLRDI
jgi:hypothetical protein